MIRRPHSTLLAALSVLSFAPAALAHDDGSHVSPQAPTAEVGLGADTADEGVEDSQDEGRQEADEGDYCGDGDYPLMDAEGYLEGQEWKPLYREVGAMLRQGRAGWQRATALSYLATAELHMGRTRPAARNFRLAFALDAESVSPALRAEQAVALLNNGQRAAAFEAASAFVQEQCVAPETWMQSACWAAHTVMARATDDVTVRETEQHAAEAARPHTDELLAEVLDFEALLDGTTPSTRVATR